MNSIIIKERIGTIEYLSVNDLAEKYNLCRNTVISRVSEMEAEVGKRYKSMAVISDGNIKRINEAAFLDWLSNRKLLRNAAKRKHAPVFKPSDWAEYLGYAINNCN